MGGSTRVRVNSQVPDAAGYTVLAREPRGGVPESWEVVVTAHCAPSSALPGLEYRRSGSVFDSTTSHGATAACSPGKRLIGVGGLIDSQGPGQDRLVLTAIRPATDLTSIRVNGREDEAGYTGGWRATAVGVCVNPVSGHLLATGTSTVDSVGTKRAIATCPAGSKIHSGGFTSARRRAGRLDHDVHRLRRGQATPPDRATEAQAQRTEPERRPPGAWLRTPSARADPDPAPGMLRPDHLPAGASRCRPAGAAGIGWRRSGPSRRACPGRIRRRYSRR